MARRPWRPKGFSGLRSGLCMLNKKNLVKLGMFDRHCNPEFMKQVFPKFYNPHLP